METTILLKLDKNSDAKKYSKLLTVKCIKELTGLGLMDSKNIADKLYDVGINEIESDLNIEEMSSIIRKFPIEIITNFVELMRDIKLLNLGIGTDEEYKEAIRDLISHKNKDLDLFINVMDHNQILNLFKEISYKYIAKN